MNILIDMNLSPEWENVLNAAGHQAIHWSKIGKGNAKDKVIMAYAKRNRHVVFTHDLDFSAILYSTGATGPSVIQLRGEDTRPVTMGSFILDALEKAATSLAQGALVTVNPRKQRISLLRLRQHPENAQE